MSSLTGYGPRSRLYFDGDETKFELWEVKFLGYLRLQKLLPVLECQDGAVNADKNADLFAELVQVLDDKSLNLVMRDAEKDGRKAIKILRDHYKGSSQPRIIGLYFELSSLKMKSEENVIDYMLRAETAATALKSAGEKIQDGLLVAMVLKGLPEEYGPFIAVNIQKGTEASFSEFKVALKNYEESEKSRRSQSATASEDNVMRMKNSVSGKNITCYSCGNKGHKSFECKNKNKSAFSSNKHKRWCEICKNTSHDTQYCRKKNSTQSVSVDTRQRQNDDSYAFKVSVSVNSNVNVGIKNKTDKSRLLVDCGATAHIINDHSKFICRDKNFDSSKHVIELANGSRSYGIVSAKGDAKVSVLDANGNDKQVILKNALCIPSYDQNIFSVQAATENGASVKFTPNHAVLQAPDGTEFSVSKSGKLYYLNTVSSQSVKQHTLQEWHKIFGHCNVKDVSSVEEVVTGMKITDRSNFNCKTCAEGKMTQFRNREADEKANARLELVHCDLSGCVDPVSIDKSKYCISFVDDYSGAIAVYFLKSKNDATAATAKFLADMAPFGHVKRLRSDNGTEFTCSDFKSLLISNRIKHEMSSPYAPHQNGTVERAWRSLFEMARCLLVESKLPRKLWNYAVRASAYIRNRCFNPRTGRTAFEMFYEKQPNVSNMHIFGSVCYAYIQNPKKLDPRSEEGIFIGYDPLSPAYLVFFPERENVKRVRCVRFHETLPKSTETPSVTYDEYGIMECRRSNEENEPQEGEEEQEDSEDKEPRRYPDRIRNKPKYLEDYSTNADFDSANCTVDYCYRVNNIPRTYEEAVSSTEANEWAKAMGEEMSSMKENNTYDLVPEPTERSVIGGRWVYAVKLGPNNEEKFKARYVAKGFSQVQDIDYRETFSPTARMTSVRTLMQVAAEENYIMHQMDVKTAYLNAEIDCEAYVEQPPGFEKTTASGRKLVCKLNRSLYGLKQSGRNWNNLLHNFLVGQHFEQSHSDHCVYTKNSVNSKVIIIVWVDDLIICASDLKVLQCVKNVLSLRFKMKDLGHLNWFLGIEFHVTDGYIKMSQTKYLEKILDRFNMRECHPKSSPCDISMIQTKTGDSKELDDPKLYREIVGSLIYAMSCTRPDLCYVVTKLSQRLAKPTYADLNLSKFVLKYIKGTLDRCLVYKKSENGLKLTGFCDSDWGGSEDRRSISGYCFQLNSTGPLISWKSKKQNIIALSSCEAEYTALTYAIQEANHLQQLMSDILNVEKSPAKLFVDNQGAMKLAKNPVQHQRSKHIDIKYHFIRSQIDVNIILNYVPSSDNVADIFTKPVTKSKLAYFSSIMG